MKVAIQYYKKIGLIRYLLIFFNNDKAEGDQNGHIISSKLNLNHLKVN